MEPAKTAAFRQELEVLINKHSLEGESDTPDYVLAQFLVASLTAFDEAINRRDDSRRIRENWDDGERS